MDDAPQTKPDWWVANERLRAEMGLPDYDPPRFVDGVYTHRVVERLESELGCTIRFVGVGVQYHEDWEVKVADETVFTIGRHRNDSGNTIYETSSDEFRTRIEDAVERFDDTENSNS